MTGKNGSKNSAKLIEIGAVKPARRLVKKRSSKLATLLIVLPAAEVILVDSTAMPADLPAGNLGGGFRRP